MEKRDKDRLLANFVGTVTRTSLLNRDEDQYQWSFPFCNGYYPSLDTMKFDKSWDWLIPVYSKWRETFLKGKYTPSEYHDYNISINIINSDILINDIELAYHHIVIAVEDLLKKK